MPSVSSTVCAAFRKGAKAAFEFLFVSKCPACGEIVRNRGDICPECAEEYRKEKEKPCPFCGFKATECVCSTRNLTFSDPAGASMHSLAFYASDRPTTEALIYSLKDSPDRSVVGFFAKELAEGIRKVLPDPADWVITFPPRSKKSIRRIGFDHTKQLARRLARELGTDCESVFYRRGGLPQKFLDPVEREENAGRSYFLKRRAHVFGKKYIIIDDVITTGATTRRCQKLLKEKGAEAFPVSITKTPAVGKGFDRKPRPMRRGIKSRSAIPGIVMDPR